MKIHPPKHPAGSIRLGCLGYIITIVLLWGGGQGIYIALKNREPLEISIQDYIAQKPDAQWIMLQNASLNLLEAAHSERFNGDIKEVYIPIRPKNQSLDPLVHVLLHSKDDGFIAKIESLKSLVNNPGRLEKLTPNDLSQYITIGSFSGLIQTGIDSSSKTRDKLAGLKMHLAKGFVILEENETPEMSKSLFMLGFGVLVGIGMIQETRRGAKTPPTSTPPNLPLKS